MRAANAMEYEEAEEISFVPSAISAPQKPLFRCDNQCSEKTRSFWQLASGVIKEGEESYTTNLCQKCYNESLKTKGDEQSTRWQWHEFVEKKAHRGRLCKMLGKEQYVREMWEYFPRKSKSEKVSTGGKKKGKQVHTVSGSWNRQPESTWSKSNAAMTLTARKE